MRPLKITMSAFGPYADKVECDLKKLGSNGLYLITGETGAGKTTIFDAISYALFGEPSGAVRNESMFRSKYAKEDVFTYVELEFEYQGRIYKIYRNPRQSRPKKKGTGFTDSDVSCTVWDESGVVLADSVDGSNKLIKSILGLERNQYKQISMIAQGDFQKLLFSDTKTKGEILRTIFQTQKYQKLQDRIKDEFSLQKRLCEKSQNEIFTYTKGLNLSEDNPCKAEINELSEQKVLPNHDEITKLCDKALDFENKRLGEVEKLKENVEKGYLKIKTQYDKSEPVFKLFKECEDNKKHYDETAPKLEKAKAKLLEAEKKQPEIQKLSQKIGVINNELSQYEDIERQLLQGKEFQHKSEELIGKIKEAESEIDKNKHSLDDKKQVCDKYKSSDVKKVEVSAQIEKACKLLDEIQKAGVVLGETEKLNNKAVGCQNEYVEYRKTFDNKRSVYNNLQTLYFDGQAGVLAQTLEDGKKCPVCGSCTHPEPALKQENIPDKQALDKAKLDVDKAYEKLGKLSDLASKANSDYENSKKNAQEFTEKYLSDCGDTKPILFAREKYKKVKKQIDEMNVEQDKYANEINEKKSAEKEIPVLGEKIKTLEDTNRADKEKAIKLNASADELKKQADERLKKLSFEYKRQGLEHINQLEKEKNAIEKEISSSKNEKEELQTENSKYYSVWQNLLKQLDGLEKPNIELLEKQKNNALNEKIQAEESFKAVNSRSDGNTRAVLNIRAELKCNEQLERKLSWLSALSNTATGQISQSARISLETYIQMAFFDRILYRANDRLIKMTNGQYELKRDENVGTGSGQKGLDINVIDHYIGEERPVKSLSGGETFLASLSLALGLSDEIQCSSGGIQIDSMFIDEGFGTLDDSTLSQAMKALNSLAEDSSLVGIISHVNELKEKIPKQIVVHKDKVNGSSLEIRTN